MVYNHFSTQGQSTSPLAAEKKLYLLGDLSDVSPSWDLLKLQQPCGGSHLASVPPDPFTMVIEGWFRGQGLVRLILTTIRQPCPRQELLHKWVQLRRVSQVLGLLCPGLWLKASGCQVLSTSSSWRWSLLYFCIPTRMESSKVTLLLSLTGLGKAACPLAGSLWGPPLRGPALPGWLAGASCGFWCIVCFLNTTDYPIDSGCWTAHR